MARGPPAPARRSSARGTAAPDHACVRPGCRPLPPEVPVLAHRGGTREHDRIGVAGYARGATAPPGAMKGPRDLMESQGLHGKEAVNSPIVQTTSRVDPSSSIEVTWTPSTAASAPHCSPQADRWRTDSGMSTHRRRMAQRSSALVRWMIRGSPSGWNALAATALAAGEVLSVVGLDASVGGRRAPRACPGTRSARRSAAAGRTPGLSPGWRA